MSFAFLKGILVMKQKSVWNYYNDYEEILSFSEDYKKFLDSCKTERETVVEVVRTAKKNGFKNFEDKCKSNSELKPGDKIYIMCNNKTIALFVIGTKDTVEGMHLICSHADSPRLDVRANPLYEKEELALMKTHYYGGIKKYQWVATPLALHGTVIKKGGEHIEIKIGEKEDDPVFYISDLPKHLSANQINLSMESGITGESLNIIAGSQPLENEEKDRVKKKICSLLKEHYNIDESDFMSAELEIVPAGKARDVGFDGSMITAYGHDDRICLYTSLRAICNLTIPTYTAGILCVDKEEVGSVGNTGMNSNYLEDIVAHICCLQGMNDLYSLKQVLRNSKMISADVVVGMDSNYSECFENNNTARIGNGPVIMKYGGHQGKKGCNDASAEFIAYVRDILDENDVIWQTGEMGRIDLGGGGTMAPFAANFGMEVLDLGIALLSMHAPYELASKADIYETYKAYEKFLVSSKELKAYM